MIPAARERYVQKYLAKRGLDVSADWIGTRGVRAYRWREDRRYWTVAVDLPHVMYGRTWALLTATAVCDDFGDLVLTGPLQ